MSQGRTAGAFISLRIESGSKNAKGQALYNQVLISLGSIAYIQELDKGRCEIGLIDRSTIRPVNWISEIEFMIEERTAFSVGRYDYRTEADTLQAYRELKLGWNPRTEDDIQPNQGITRAEDARETAPTDSDRVGAPTMCLDCDNPIEDEIHPTWHGGEGPLCTICCFSRMQAEIETKPEIRNELLMLQMVVDDNQDLSMDQMITKLEAYCKDKGILNLPGLASELKNLPVDLPF